MSLSLRQAAKGRKRQAAGKRKKFGTENLLLRSGRLGSRPVVVISSASEAVSTHVLHAHTITVHSPCKVHRFKGLTIVGHRFFAAGFEEGADHTRVAEQREGPVNKIQASPISGLGRKTDTGI